MFEDYVFAHTKHYTNQTGYKRTFVQHFSLIDNDFSEIFKFIDSFKNYESINKNVKIVSIFGETTDASADVKHEIIRKAFGVRPPETLSCIEKVYNNEFVQINGYYDIRKSVIILHLTSLLDSRLQYEYESSSVDELLVDNCDAQLGLYKALLLLFRLSHIVMVHYTSIRFQSSAQRLFRLLSNLSNRFESVIIELFRTNYSELTAFSNGRISVPNLLFLFDGRYQAAVNDSNYSKSIDSMQNRITTVLRDVITQKNPLFNLSKDHPFVYFIFHKDYSSPQHFLMYSKSSANDRSISAFVLPHVESRPDTISSKNFFVILQIFLAFLKNKTNNRDTKMILDEFCSIVDVSGRFSKNICEKTLVTAFKFYQEKLPPYYNQETHRKKKEEALRLFQEISKGSYIEDYSAILIEQCDDVWLDGRQLCETVSLTGNSCSSPVHLVPGQEPVEGLSIVEHSNAIKHVSACNCGRRQGKRLDPFNLKAGNFDFYNKMNSNCRNCRVIKSIQLPESIHFNKKNCHKANKSKKEADHARLEKPDNEDDSSTQSSEDDEKDDENYEEKEDEEQEQDKDHVTQEQEEEEDYEDETESKMDESFDIEGCELSSCSEEIDEEGDQEDEEEEEEENDDDDDDDDDTFDEESDPENIQLQDAKIDSDDSKDALKLVPMLHTKCPRGIYPSFPSWSLVKLGHSSLYSHDKGLKDQQGFIKGSNYLMPWNVSVVLQHRRGQKLWDGKPPSGIKKKKRTKAGFQFTVKIFLGTEYECLKGHRFICSGPKQILRRQTEKNIKDEKIQADAIATNNMPIYIHCMCHKEDSPSVAQLIRVHVVTPKVPIDVTLNPFVRVSNRPDATVFYPGQTEPIKLEQASYWVLRLPLFYEDDNGPIGYPNHRNLPKDFCLQSGCYGISNEYDLR